MFKRSAIVLLLFFYLAISQLAFAQESAEIDNRIWSIQYWQKLADQGLVPVNPQVDIPAALETRQELLSPMAIGDNNPDVAVTSATNTTQSENSIFVNPNDNTKVLNSNNSTNFPVSAVFGTSGFMSSTSGASWTGSVQGTGGGNSGDPAAVIGLTGRYFVGYIAANGGQGVAFSDNEGVSWTHVQVGPNPGSLADKNHLWIDNTPGSPFQGRLYSAWTDFGGVNDGNIVISRSTNNGATWTARQNISNALGPYQQGVNVQTGPNGEVYVLYTNYTSGGVQDEPVYSMSRSLDGGVSWTAQNIITGTRGIRVSGTSKNMRTNSFPSAAVDISGGANNGNIYMVWTNIGVPGINTGTDRSIYMIRSTNNGTTWGSPIKVNQDPSGLGNQHYSPWITCDPVSGDLAVIYYDDRNVSSTQCEVYVAVSQDAGNTWTDFQVSDVAFTPSPIPGLAGGYFGDYLAIAARGGKVYPTWTDNRSGRALTYVSPFDITGGGNIAPTAEANGPYSAELGQSITFSSAGSNDPDGTIVSYLWNFGDGSTSSAANPSHTYSSAGTFNVTLTVTDDGGFTGNDAATATVTLPGGNYATLPYSTGFEAGTVDQFWTLTSSPEGRILITTANTPHTGSFHMTMDDNLNGGLLSQNEAWLRLNLAGQSQVELNFWWKDFADETHVQDGVFLSSNDGASFVKVLNLNGPGFTDNVWNNFTLDIDQLAAANGLSLSSTFVIKFQQFDNFGIATDGAAWDDISVTAGPANLPPTANANGPYTGNTGVAVSFSSAGSSDPDGTITGYSWSFGDGGTSTAANPSHTYAAAGTYNVSLTVTDNSGATDVDNTTATITDLPTGDWVVITSDGFENGFGSYVDGGADCRRSSADAAFAWEGTFCVRLQDNSGASSSTFYGSSQNISAYDELRIEFFFYPRSMENGEDFFVEVSGNGSAWTTVANYAAGTHFNNNNFYQVSGLIFSKASAGLTNTLFVRIRCDASNNSDWIYLDNIEVAGRSTAAPLENTRDQVSLSGLPTVYELEQNYPNPFNPSTTLTFALPQDATVSLKVYDITGRLVRTLVNGNRSAGNHTVQWKGLDDNGSKVASGIYIYRIIAGEFVQTRRMILLK